MKNEKATGIDNMNTELLKYAPTNVKYIFLDIINICWKTYQIPKSWLTAMIAPIFKKGEQNQCNSYRGINLLHAGYKIYAKILNMRLSRIAETKLSEEQCGFQKGRSCMDGIFTTKLIIEKKTRI
jgi:hypothetical protein